MPKLIIAVLAASSLFSLSVIHAQTTDLDRFVGKDLWRNRLSKKEQLRLDSFLGSVPRHMSEPAAWHVWKTNRNGRMRYLVLLGKPEVIIPGGSSANLQLFDAAGKRINSWSFQTGWRMTFDSASIEFSNNLETDLIVLRMARFINGRNVAKEYFAISNDRLRFARMENDKGELVQNEYIFPNSEIGIVPAANISDEWVHLLESRDKADVLSALVFLGGRHIDGPDRDFGHGPHESKYAELFQQLAGSARIRDLIESLSKSENEWVRQAAALALRGPRERLYQ